MHAHSIDEFRHEHIFLGADHDKNARKTWIVIGVCGAMMLVEIVGGSLFGSMALVADGLHMSTHAGALLIAALAYSYARRFARDSRFTFGTGKLGDLAAFTSAIVLAMIAALIGYESVGRLLHPVSIAFDQAIPIAVVGLGVNLLSAWLLKDDHDHHQDVPTAHQDGHDDHRHHEDDDHHHAHRHRQHDHNLRAAYVHVIADAAVSVLAIIGLLAGRQLGWIWMDALMGIVGACVIANWSFGLVKAAGAVLLDMGPDPRIKKAIVNLLERGTDRIADMHLWRVGPGHNAAIVSLVSDHPLPPSFYRARLAAIPGLSHISVEIEPCPGVH